MTENKIDWNKYAGNPADFIHPDNQNAGWQYGAEFIGIDPALFPGMENLRLKDKDGNIVLIPIALAQIYILLHSQSTPDNLEDY